MSNEKNTVEESTDDAPKAPQQKCTFVTIIIERDAMTKIPKEVPLYEVAIYNRRFSIKRLAESEKIYLTDPLEPLDVQGEYLRLVEQHGNGEDGIAHAVSVYGSGRDGLIALTKAMNKAGCNVEVPDPEDELDLDAVVIEQASPKPAAKTTKKK
jgi:hypothetical protein